MTRASWNRSFTSVLLLTLVACGADVIPGSVSEKPNFPSPTPPPDRSDALFQPDHLLEVSITLPPADWDALRVESPMGVPKVTCASQPTARAYTYFSAEITIDGTTTSNVAIRKKGGFGSLSNTRPSLKVKANKYVRGQRISGLKRLTLNNNHQDPSLISQCLGYSLFQEAGVESPRCSFLHLTVNGNDLGIYTNVESIKKGFLKRRWADPSGNLYEAGGDFRQGMTGYFEPKVNRIAPDCSDLDPLVTALQAPDVSLRTELESVFDLEQFTTFWAMEVITDHWDGHANNVNNFYVYHDPTSDKFQFIPWGVDSLFEGSVRRTRPNSVYACGILPWRMYDVVETRTLYLARLRELLDTVWDVTKIRAEIDRMETLLSPAIAPAQSAQLALEIDTVRLFVDGRRQLLLDELSNGPPVWPTPLLAPPCLVSLGSISGTFDTSWGTLDQFPQSSGSVTGNIATDVIDSTTVLANAGLGSAGRGVIQLFAELADGRYLVLTFSINNLANVSPGVLQMNFTDALAFVSYYDPVTDTSTDVGMSLAGTLTLTQAGTGVNAAIVGSFNIDVAEM